jgi:Transglycosylase-like domain
MGSFYNALRSNRLHSRAGKSPVLSHTRRVRHGSLPLCETFALNRKLRTNCDIAAEILRMSFLSTLLKAESGGRNIPAGPGVMTNSGQPQGFFQITTGTWNEFGGTQFSPTPLRATYNQQAQIAQQIPLGRWDPNTIAALHAGGYSVNKNQTLGENLANNGETIYGIGPPGSGLEYGQSGQALAEQYAPPVDISGYPVAGTANSLDNSSYTSPAQGDSADNMAISGADYSSGSANQTPFESGFPDTSQSSTGGVVDLGAMPGSNEDPYASIVSGQYTPATPSSSDAFTSSNGSPVTVTNASDVGQQAGQSIQQGASDVAKAANTAANTLSNALGTTETNAATTATGLVGSVISAAQGWFVQGGFIALGLLVIAGAFVFFYAERKTT